MEVASNSFFTVGDGQEIVVPLKQVFSSLNDQRSRSEFCDVILSVGTKRIIAHRNILSANSPYFRKAFLSGDVTEAVMYIECIDGSALESLIDYFYNTELLINVDTAQNLLVAAKHLELNEITLRCATELEYNLSPSNCLAMKNFANTHQCTYLNDVATKYLLDHFEAVRQIEEFLWLSVDQLGEIIASDDLGVANEEIVLESVIAWVKHEEQQRKMFLGQLLGKVRLPLLGFDLLARMSESDTLIRSDYTCCHLIDEANTQLITLGRSLGRCPEVLIRIGNDDQISLLQGFGLFPSKWQIIPRYKDQVKRIFTNAAVSGNTMYLTDRDNDDVTYGMLEFNLETLQWRGCRPPTIYRGTLAVLEERLYSIGGEDGPSGAFNALERYDPLTRKWTSLASLMESGERLCVASFGGSLYAFVSLEVRAVRRSANSFGYAVYRFAPDKNRWFHLTNRIHLPEEPISVAVYREHIYILAATLGRDHSAAGKHVCSGFNTYQFEPVRRNFLKIKNSRVLDKEKYESITLLTINDKLYAIEYSQDLNIDEYVCDEGRWVRCPTIKRESFNSSPTRLLIVMSGNEGLESLEKCGENFPAAYPRSLEYLIRCPKNAVVDVP